MPLAVVVDCCLPLALDPASSRPRLCVPKDFRVSPFALCFCCSCQSCLPFSLIFTLYFSKNMYAYRNFTIFHAFPLSLCFWIFFPFSISFLCSASLYDNFLWLIVFDYTCRADNRPKHQQQHLQQLQCHITTTTTTSWLV